MPKGSLLALLKRTHLYKAHIAQRLALHVRTGRHPPRVSVDPHPRLMLAKANRVDPLSSTNRVSGTICREVRGDPVKKTLPIQLP